MFDPRKPASGKLAFGEPERPSDVYVAYVDGASRGNPGPASYAVVLREPDGKIKFEIGKYLGRATNNVAEYHGLITALDCAAAQGISRLRVRSDSQLLVRQMQGRYKVKSADLRPLHERAQKLARTLAYFAIEHIPREENSAADELANLALDRTSTQGVSRAAPVSHPVPTPGPNQEAAATSVRPRTARAGRAIRARYSAGSLHPLEALDLAEGEIVEIKIVEIGSAKPGVS